jgi:hypothetical protein
MAKAIALTPDALRAPQITPKAATPPRASALNAEPAPVPDQTRPSAACKFALPREQVRAIKVAAAERDQTISDFMLACFHAYMKTSKHA